MISTQPEESQETSEEIQGSTAPSSPQASVKFPAKRPLLKGAQRSGLSVFDFRAIKRWVAMEERVVHGCPREEEAPAVIIPKEVSLPKPLSKKPLKTTGNPKSRFPWAAVFLWVVVAVVVVFGALYYQTIHSPQEGQDGVTVPSSKVEFGSILSSNVPTAVGQKGLETLAANQQEAIRELKKEIQRLNQKLRSGQAEIQTLGPREADYREELYQMTLQYEADLSLLRQINQRHEEDLLALQQANQAMEGLVHDLRSNLQDSQIALETSKQESVEVQSSRAEFPAGADQFQFSSNPRAALQSEGIRGKVVMVNSRYQFVIISVGAKKGVRIGQDVVFYQDKKEIAAGRVERVFPTLSGVAVFDETVLDQIQEGDKLEVTGY